MYCIWETERDSCNQSMGEKTLAIVKESFGAFVSSSFIIVCCQYCATFQNKYAKIPFHFERAEYKWTNISTMYPVRIMHWTIQYIQLNFDSPMIWMVDSISIACSLSFFLSTFNIDLGTSRPRSQTEGLQVMRFFYGNIGTLHAYTKCYNVVDERRFYLK